MNRAWFLLLAVSVGLNAAMLYVQFSSPRTGPAERLERRMERPARPGERGGPERTYAHVVERRVERMRNELGLSDAQVEALRAIGAANADSMQDLRESSRSQREAMRELLTAAPIDSAEIRAAGRRLRDIEARIGAMITDNLIREAAVLEPAQRAAYLEMMRFDRRGRRGR